MDKPVIILGGGFIGTMLALYLADSRPELHFELNEAGSTLGGAGGHLLHENEYQSLLKLLHPAISKKWHQSFIKIKNTEKILSISTSLISASDFHSYSASMLKDRVKLNNDMSLEIALRQSSFVIDTRDTCYFRSTGYKHELRLEVELEDIHSLLMPCLFETLEEPGDTFSYFPLNENRLILSHTFLSEQSAKKRDEQINRILCFLKRKGFKIKKVLSEDMSLHYVPQERPHIHQENRVLSLADFNHPSAGRTITEIARLLKKMTSTSFRYGELKSLMRIENPVIEKRSHFCFYLNRQILKNEGVVLDSIFNQSSAVIERYFMKDLSPVDQYRILSKYYQKSIVENLRPLLRGRTVKKIVTMAEIRQS